MARQFGVSEELLDAMYHIDQHLDMFSERELVALHFAEIMTTSARDVSEELWDQLQFHFNDGEIVELATVIGLFNFFNRFADALAIDPPPGTAQNRANGTNIIKEAKEAEDGDN